MKEFQLSRALKKKQSGRTGKNDRMGEEENTYGEEEDTLNQRIHIRRIE